MVGALGEDDHRNLVQTHLLEALGQVLGNIGQVGFAEGLESVGRQLARVRVEDLDQLGTGLDLQGQVLDADLGNLLEEGLGGLGILVDPRLALLVRLGAAALGHVAEQGPGGAAEADEGDAPLELLAGHGDGLVDVVELGGDVDLLLHDLFVLAVVRAAQGLREVRAELVDHLDHHAHGLRDDEDVGEDDGGVDQAGEALNGLQGQGGGDLGVAAALEEVAAGFGFVVFGQVAAGCSVQTKEDQLYGREAGRGSN